MIAHTLTYGNVSSSEHGVYISGEGVYNAPERVVELVSVPGRNGALTIDQGHYDNITIEYPCFTFATSQEEFRRIVNDFKNAMIAQGGYQKLSDDYNPDEYRMALFVEGIEFEPVQYGRAGSFTLTFNCKPQRYLVDGDTEVTITNGSILNNPTLYDAEPLLMVEGYGDVEFNGYTISLENGSIGTVNLWQKANVSKRVGTPMQVSISHTFDKSMFENGDAFTFGVNQTFDVYDEISSMTKTNADAVNSWNDNNDGSIRLMTTINNCSFVVGTSKTITNTSSFTFISTDSVTVDMSIVYDGNQSVTYTVSYTVTNPSTLGTFLNAYMSECSANSSLTRLGHPTYIDCEIGEAYKYVNGSLVGLNSYIDLGSDLPKLAPSNNTFTLSNTITSLIVVPRYWEL